MSCSVFGALLLLVVPFGLVLKVLASKKKKQRMLFLLLLIYIYRFWGKFRSLREEISEKVKNNEMFC